MICNGMGMGTVVPGSGDGVEDRAIIDDKKAQLSLTNPRDAKACQNCSDSTCLQRCR